MVDGTIPCGPGTSDLLYSLAHVTSRRGNRVRERPRRLLLRALLATTVVALLVASGVAVAVLHGRGSLNSFLCEGPCGPQYVANPDGLEVLDPAGQQLSSPPVVDADAAAVEAALEPALAQPLLGPRVGVSVRELGGTELFTSTSDAFIPASTTKVLTGFATLTTLDPRQRFSTTTVLDRSGLDGTRLVLVGGGDPYLMATPGDRGFAAPADLQTLAERTAEQLDRQGVTQVQLGYDATLFTGPASNPTWEPGYASQNVVSPIAALWVDRGRVDKRRVEDPPLAAAQIFAAQLGQLGLTVTGVEPVEAPASATPVAEVEGPTVAQAVERMELMSDNGAAEVLARHVAIATGGEASFDGATSAVVAALAAAGVETDGLVLRDGSGLSRQNRIGPSTLTSVLATADDVTPGLVADLPVAGFSGTLAERFDGVAGRGLARVKTGALNQVHSLAGTVTTADGVVLTVAVMIDQADLAQTLASRAAVDAVVASLASCTCAG